MIQKSLSWAHIQRKNMVWKYTCALTFIAELFAIVKIWKQHKCSLTDEWIKEIWCIYTMKYYPAIKKNKIMSVAATRLEVNQAEKDKYHGISYMLNLKQGYKWTYLQYINIFTDLENEHMITRGEGHRGGIVWEFGIDMYALLYLN